MTEIEAKRKEDRIMRNSTGWTNGFDDDNYSWETKDVREVIKETFKEARKEFLDWFGLIDDNQCGCDRCLSCKIIINDKIKELKQSLGEPQA